MSISVVCPACSATLKAPTQLAGKNIHCPKCGKSMLIPSAAGPAPNWMADATPKASEAPYRLVADEPVVVPQHRPAPSQPTSFGTRQLPSSPEQSAYGQPLTPPPPPIQKTTMNQVGRFFSLPWIILIFVFGFLPWSEVSCNAKDIHLRVTQSGYQTLYGGVGSSYNLAQLAQDKVSAQMEIDREQFAKTLEAKRSVLLASFSPFAAVFWAGALALLLVVLLAPLSFSRLKYCVPLAAVMVLMLVVQLVLGTPLERAINDAVQQVIEKDPAKAIVVAASISSGETVWFWLVFTAIFLTAAMEVLTNLLWRNSYAPFSHIGPLSVVISAAVIAVAGVGLQGLLWQVGVMRMESHLADFDRAEQERIAKVKAVEEKEREAQRLRQEELEQQAEQQRLEYERVQHALQVRQQEHRLETEKKDRELEQARLENERQKIAAEQERQKMEDKASEELKARQAEEKLREEKAAELARQEAKARIILKSGEGFAVRKFPKQAREKYQEVIDKYPETPSAETARELIKKME